MVGNHGEELLPPLQLPIIADEKPTVNAPLGAIEKLKNTYKLFQNTVYGIEIVSTCGSFGLPHERNLEIPSLRRTPCRTYRTSPRQRIAVMNKTPSSLYSSIRLHDSAVNQLL